MTVQVDRQLLASSAPLLLPESRTSTLTVSSKVVSIAVFAPFNALMSRVTLLADAFVWMTPLTAPAVVLLSYALKPPTVTGTARGFSAIIVVTPRAGSFDALMVRVPDAAAGAHDSE